MKKQIYNLMIIILLVLLLSACEKDIEYNYEIYTAEKIEEYDDLWEFLEENFTRYLQELELLDVDINQLKSNYRNKIIKAQSFDEYHKVLTMFTREFKFLGHIEVYDVDEFLRLNEAYKNFEDTIKKIKNSEEIEVTKNSYNIYSPFFFDDDSYNRYNEIKSRNNSSEDERALTSYSPSNINVRTYKNQKTLYIKYKDFFDNYRDKHKETIVNELNEFPYDKVIVDVHGNPGGNSPVWWDIVSLLSNEPIKVIKNDCFQGEVAKNFSEVLINNSGLELVKTEEDFTVVRNEYQISPSVEVVNRPKQVYIIQGDNFSAAEEFCNFSRDANWGTRIGQPIGGNGQGYNYFYKLKHSDLLIRLAISHPCYTDGKAKSLVIEPDIEMEYNVHDILNYVFNDEIK